MDTDFKYFVKLEKAFKEGNNYFVQGIASGTREDRDGERMNRGVMEEFVKSLPLPLTNSHPRAGELLGEMGEVVKAEVLSDEDNSLFVKARLDTDHPGVPYLIKQIEKGKKYAFSIEGKIKESKTVYSDRLKKMITEFTKVIPKAISITSEPSYIPSFLEVVEKSYAGDVAKNETIVNNQGDNLLHKESMKDDKVIKTETEQVTAEVVEGAEVIATEVPEVAEVAVEEVKDETEVVEVPVETPVEVEKSYSEIETEELKETISEKTEEAIAEAVEEMEEEAKQDEMSIKIDMIGAKLDSLMSIIQSLVESDQLVHDEMGKTAKELSDLKTIQKSFHDEIEVIKDLPLAKKSRVIAKSYEERAVEEPKRPFVGAIENILASN